jgi:hypothetical protein
VATQPLATSDAMLAHEIQASCIAYFTIACARATYLLRFRTLEDVIAGVARRKSRHATNPFDVPRAEKLILTFMRLRLFFPRNYLCLYDSLALIEFLAYHKLFPTWVFGIKLEPWAAHCWVQQASFILNEDVEAAAGYSPVMAV